MCSYFSLRLSNSHLYFHIDLPKGVGISIISLQAEELIYATFLNIRVSLIRCYPTIGAKSTPYISLAQRGDSALNSLHRQLLSSTESSEGLSSDWRLWKQSDVAEHIDKFEMELEDDAMGPPETISAFKDEQNNSGTVPLESVNLSIGWIQVSLFSLYHLSRL
ncbi:unnamed protein product [Protopolystoma xenopodis]|uniref:Uncharacterized protein n=1 Tax=Protopolystoma xenopodis TaxID=117903 RepID=A0A3S5CQU1_9PLAT|nr:unnamed protein product [Protopolystoma xenopodis]